jgi:hypothetical protein
MAVVGTVTMLALTPAPAHATYPVIDEAALAKLAEQLDAAKRQIETLTDQLNFLTKISNTVQEQVDAIGRLMQIPLPMVNLVNMSNQVLQDARCLKPDLSELMKGLQLDYLEFDSICQGRETYQKALWVDPESEGWTDPDAEDGSYNPDITWEDQAAARETVKARRAALLKNVAATGLAQGDIAATKTAEENQRATEQLEAAAAAAETVNARLAVLAKGSVLANRQMVQRNQLLAQLVKIQSAMLMEMTLPVTARPPLPEDVMEGAE